MHTYTYGIQWNSYAIKMKYLRKKKLYVRNCKGIQICSRVVCTNIFSEWKIGKSIFGLIYLVRFWIFIVSQNVINLF